MQQLSMKLVTQNSTSNNYGAQPNAILQQVNEIYSSQQLRIYVSNIKRNLQPTQINLIPTSEDIALLNKQSDMNIPSSPLIKRKAKQKSLYQKELETKINQTLQNNSQKFQNESQEDITLPCPQTAKPQQEGKFPILKNYNSNSTILKQEPFFGIRKNTSVRGKLIGRLPLQTNELRNAFRESSNSNHQNGISSSQKSQEIKLDSLKEVISSRTCFFSPQQFQLPNSYINNINNSINSNNNYNINNNNIMDEVNLKIKIQSERISFHLKKPSFKDQLIIQPESKCINRSQILKPIQGKKESILTRNDPNLSIRISIDTPTSFKQLVKGKTLISKSPENTENRSLPSPLKEKTFKKKICSIQNEVKTSLQCENFEMKRKILPSCDLQKIFQIGEEVKVQKSSYFEPLNQNQNQKQEQEQPNSKLFVKLDISSAEQFLKCIKPNKHKQFSTDKACSPIQADPIKPFSFSSAYSQYEDSSVQTRFQEENDTTKNNYDFQPWQSQDLSGMHEIISNQDIQYS